MNTKKLSGARLVLAMAALFLTTSCTMGDMAGVPIFGVFYEIFPQTSLVNAIISAPSIVGLFFCLLGGYLTDKVDKKWLMVGGFGLYTVTSVFGAAIENVYYILICRCLATGAAWGLTSSAALSIIADLFEDEQKRGTVNGWYNAAMAMVGAILSFIGGILAVGAWQNAFHTYWVNIPILIMLIIFLPSMPPKKAVVAETKKTSSASLDCWYNGLIPIVIEVILVASCYYVIAYTISVYVSETGIGNEAFSGTLSSVGTIFSFLANLGFGFIYGKLRKATAVPSFIIFGIGFLLMAFFPTKAVAIAACAFMGAFWGIFYSYFYTETTVVVPEEKQGTAIGVVNAVNGMAMVVCTYGVTFLRGFTSEGTLASVFPILGVICFAMAVFAIVLWRKEKQ